MARKRASATWLSAEMACALAAMCPPLQAADVERAADSLTDHAASPDVVIVDTMFRADIDRVNLRNLIAALRALHDLPRGTPAPDS